jgi:hypothetical protein
VLFSTASPGLHIDQHCGPHNERLTVHCGVEIPDGPGLWVAGVRHRWVQDKCVIFDDSFEHEVKYPKPKGKEKVKKEKDSNGTQGTDRVILFFHIPHPLIESGEVQSTLPAKGIKKNNVFGRER